MTPRGDAPRRRQRRPSAPKQDPAPATQQTPAANVPPPATAQQPATAMQDDLGRIVVWPLFVGATVLAVGWSAWRVSSGEPLADVASVVVSGAATFLVGVLGIVLLVSTAMTAYERIPPNLRKLVTLDWIVPIAVVAGVLLGLAVWQ